MNIPSFWVEILIEGVVLALLQAEAMKVREKNEKNSCKSYFLLRQKSHFDK